MWALVVLLVLGGAAGGLQLRRMLAGRRELREVPLWTIAEAPDTITVRLVGTVRARGELLSAPISGRACCYYDTIAHDHGRYGSTEIAHETRSSELEIVDASGVVVVDPATATWDLVPTVTRCSPLVAPTPEMVKLVEKTDYQGSFLSVTFAERTCQVGDVIAVIGIVERREGGARMRPFTISTATELVHTQVPAARAWWRQD